MNQQDLRFAWSSQQTNPKIQAVSAVMVHRAIADLLPNVLGFLYLSKETHRIHYYKNLCHTKIQDADFSRKTDEEMFFCLPSQWMFFHHDERIMMEGTNCTKCGNYKIVGIMHRFIPSSIMCHDNHFH